MLIVLPDYCITREEKGMAKKGRPFVYQSEEEKPVTVSVRLPRDLYKQVERYMKMHPGMTLTEFFLDGARLRLETPADPRDIILSDNNTVIQEVQEMIRTAVQAEIGKLRDFMGPHVSTLGTIPAPEPSVEPVVGLSQDNNTVIQQEAPQRKGGRPRSPLGQQILDLLVQHPEGLTAEQMRGILTPSKPLGDTLSGMKRLGTVRTVRAGKSLRYVVATRPSENERIITGKLRLGSS
jgi:hypothetical protein